MIDAKTASSKQRIGPLSYCALVASLLVSGSFFVHSIPGSPLRASIAACTSPDYGDRNVAFYQQPNLTQEADGDSTGVSLSQIRFERSETQQSKNIEDIQPGDTVLAWDEATDRFGAKRVLRVFKRNSDHLRILQIESNATGAIQELRTTDEHPFWVVGEGWVLAGDLQLDARVMLSDRNVGIVTDSQRQRKHNGVAVYNFEVEDYHTYFVAQSEQFDGILVHNNPCKAPDLPPGRKPNPDGSPKDLTDQLEEIMDAQNRNRKGIDSIRKSQQDEKIGFEDYKRLINNPD